MEQCGAPVQPSKFVMRARGARWHLVVRGPLHLRPLRLLGIPNRREEKQRRTTTTTTNGGLATSKEETLWGATQTEWRIGVGSDAGPAVGPVACSSISVLYQEDASILSEINLQMGVPALRVQIVLLLA